VALADRPAGPEGSGEPQRGAPVYRVRRPRLPSLGRPRRLSPEEAAALKARPWPRLPWWLWLAAATSTVVLVATVVGIFRTVPNQLPPAERRSPPAQGLSHGVGEVRVPILLPANADRLVRRQASCPRLDRVTLVGTAGEVAMLDAAATKLCALRSTAPIQRARDGLQQAGAVVAFAEFQLSINESTTRFGAGPPEVLVHAKFQQGDAAPERVAAVLAHEGSHVADARMGGQPAAADELRARQSELVTAASELEARKSEMEACGRLFGSGIQPNRGCADAAALLAEDDAAAIRRLKEAGFK
jgi:hypothetical protein